ncbi:hypothetical protein [Ekhidna sp.]|uniref:hypothetical protein n=1 Tax=Ekhidna sp. TaxID=2608089 RepID=UPI003CCC0169
MKNINWSDHILNFLAVIIGVSLAFYINEYSETKRLQSERNDMINSFLEELRNDRAVFTDYQIPNNKSRASFLEKAVNASETNLDSMAYYVRRGLGYTNYTPQNVTFNSVVSSGKLDLIEDFDLRKSLSQYHTVYVQEAKLRGEGQVEFYNSNILPWLIKNSSFNDPSGTPQVTQEFINMLIVYKMLINSKVSQYELIVEKGSKLDSALVAYAEYPEK